MVKSTYIEYRWVKLMKTLKKILLGIGISVLSLVIIAGIGFAIIKVPTLTIDFSQQSELTGRASGFLYGIAEDDVPTAESVDILYTPAVREHSCSWYALICTFD